MARLRLLRIAVGAGLLLGCAGAGADPVSLIATAIVYAGGYTGLTAFAILAAGSIISSSLASNAAKRKQAAAAAAQRAQYNASLQDRNVTGLSAEAPWQVVYGNPAPIGGSLCAILSSGAKDEFKHLLIVFAAHESQAIDEVYIEGEPVGALNANGDAIDGAFVEDVPVPTSGLARWVGHVFTEAITFNTSGQGTASQSVVSVVSAIYSYTTPETTVTTAGFGSLIPAGSYTYPGEYVEESRLVTASGTALTISPIPATPITVSVTYVYRKVISRVNIQKHLSPGGVDVADAYINARVPGSWGVTDKLSGYTYIWITLDQNFARFQGGPPNISARLRGKKIYDWRTGTTVYSQNPALCLADFITSRAGFGATQAQIDSASVIASANAADAAGFLCDGSFRTEQGRDATKQQLEDCFGATCHESGGVWRINAGAWTAPVLSITDADCAAPIQIGQASYTAKERFNTVRGKFVDGAGLGVATDFSPWKNSAYVTADGAEKVLDVTFPFTKDHQRCQDLARMLVERSRGGLTITYPGHMRLWPLQPGDRVSITNAEFGWSAKTFRVTDWAFHPKTPVALQMVEDVAVYYNAAAVIAADAAPNTNLPNPFTAPDLAGLTAASGTAQLLKQADGSITTRVYLQWVAATNQYVITGGNVQVQWRRATATDDVWQNMLLPGDASSGYVIGLTDGFNFLFRARFVSQLGITGQWNTIAHEVVGKIEPPTPPSNVSLTQSLVFWTKAADIDLDGYLIRSQPGTGGVWSRGTPLHDGIITATPFTLTTRLYGVQTVMVVSIDTSGNISQPAFAVLDFGQPDTGNVVQTRDYRALGWPGTLTNCAVVGGDLLANALASSDDYALVDAYGEPDVYATQYAALEWISPSFSPQYGGGVLSLAYTAAGTNAMVDYRIDGDNTYNMYSSTDVYASTDLYGPAGGWQAWPGAMAVGRMLGIQWRASIGSSAEQGKLSAFVASLAAQEVAQTFASQAIGSAGTRLVPANGTPARSWISLRSVQITPYADGSGAIAGRLLDFSPTLGPLSQLVDNTGAAVSGAATIELRGLADV